MYRKKSYKVVCIQVCSTYCTNLRGLLGSQGMFKKTQWAKNVEFNGNSIWYSYTAVFCQMTDLFFKSNFRVVSNTMTLVFSVNLFKLHYTILLWLRNCINKVLINIYYFSCIIILLFFTSHNNLFDAFWHILMAGIF